MPCCHISLILMECLETISLPNYSQLALLMTLKYLTFRLPTFLILKTLTNCRNILLNSHTNNFLYILVTANCSRQYFRKRLFYYA